MEGTGNEISIDDAPDWVMEVESVVQRNETLRTEESDAWKKHSIYKLPKGFVGDQEKRIAAYKPQVVSLGPYHHGEEQLGEMEKHKLRALRRLLVRTKKSVRDYREALKQQEVLQQLMDSYKDLDPSWRKDEERFLMVMILDGCFMLEVMRLITMSTFREYDENDPIFSYNGLLSNLPRIKRDMLKLENQIPFLVLDELFVVENVVENDKSWSKSRMETRTHDATALPIRGIGALIARLQKESGPIPKVNNDSVPYNRVNEMVLDFFELGKKTPPSLTCGFMRRMLPCFFQSNSAPVTETNNAYPPAAATTSSDDHEVWGLHVLDVVRKSMIKEIKGRRRRSGGVQTGSNDVISPATQLEEAGIQFRKSDSTSLKDITFQTGFLHATLSLPQLLVDDATESKFLNLMSFEHLHTGSGKEVSSYVCFMDNIIDSDKDVSLLSKNNIIKNFVGTDQAVADLFNGISHDVSIDPASNLGGVHRDVTAYCNDPFNENCANLKHGYFSTPWSVIAFVAASVALVITIIQFVYALLSYYFHKG